MLAEIGISPDTYVRDLTEEEVVKLIAEANKRGFGLSWCLRYLDSAVPAAA